MKYSKAVFSPCLLFNCSLMYSTQFTRRALTSEKEDLCVCVCVCDADAREEVEWSGVAARRVVVCIQRASYLQTPSFFFFSFFLLLFPFLLPTRSISISIQVYSRKRDGNGNVVREIWPLPSINTHQTHHTR